MIQRPLPAGNTLSVIIAMLCITVLAVFGLVEGINGALFVTAIAALAGLGGYQVKKQADVENGKGKKPPS